MDQKSEYLSRFLVTGFPTIKILNADGFSLGTPDGRSPEDFALATKAGKRADAKFKADLAAADMTKPETRSNFVLRHAARGDVESARRLYDGFDAKDVSDARWKALVGLARYLTRTGKLEETDALLAVGEKLFRTDEQKMTFRELRANELVWRLETAFSNGEKARALELLDEIAKRYPEHQVAKDRESIRKTIEDRLK